MLAMESYFDVNNIAYEQVRVGVFDNAACDWGIKRKVEGYL